MTDRVNIRTVQKLIGHKTIQMTVRYGHLARSTSWKRFNACATLGLHRKVQLTPELTPKVLAFSNRNQ